jgi:glutathione synthase/RimK-type ligase-like ATP-grasp enzyme
VIPPNEIVFTNEVSIEEVLENESAIALAPGIFQGYVPKAYELRVTVVGRSIFAVRIDSQASESTQVDWRRDQTRKMYERATLDEKTSLSILDYMRLAGLLYAAFDFVVTPEGDCVFLECNPGGQWLWLEHSTGYGITDSLVELLLGSGM